MVKGVGKGAFAHLPLRDVREKLKYAFEDANRMQMWRGGDAKMLRKWVANLAGGSDANVMKIECKSEGGRCRNNANRMYMGRE